MEYQESKMKVALIISFTGENTIQHKLTSQPNMLVSNSENKFCSLKTDSHKSL